MNYNFMTKEEIVRSLTASRYLPVSGAVPVAAVALLGRDGVVLPPPVSSAAVAAAAAAAASAATAAAAIVALVGLLGGGAAPVLHDEDHPDGDRGQTHGHAAQDGEHWKGSDSVRKPLQVANRAGRLTFGKIKSNTMYHVLYSAKR